MLALTSWNEQAGGPPRNFFLGGRILTYRRPGWEVGGGAWQAKLKHFITYDSPGGHYQGNWPKAN